ncbi:MAG: hypothetical protein AAF492_25760, partial [Verrucomicrobiota bacterium]
MKSLRLNVIQSGHTTLEVRGTMLLSNPCSRLMVGVCDGESKGTTGHAGVQPGNPVSIRPETQFFRRFGDIRRNFNHRLRQIA